MKSDRNRSRKEARQPSETTRTPPTMRGEPAPAAPSSSSSARQLPQIPGYEIFGELGRGGMGVVYKARQTALKRLVALKVILAGSHASATDLARFRIEAEAVARVRHPGIVQIYEIGEHDGLPYFSLEYCSGGSLAERLANEPAPRPKQAARLVEQVARAIHEAHEENIVHRDLKPANILLEETGGKRPFGRPKVTDFGLARRLDASVKQTQTGSVMGTPSYMAPEQAGGSTKKIGPATDIYALGAILYELLTGRPPFVGGTPLETIMQVVAAEPVPPRQRRRRVPRDLDVICLKCLRKDPTQRYESADDLADDLRRFLDGEPIAARPVGPLERAVMWASRNTLAAGLGAVALVLFLGLILVWIKFRAAEQQRLHATEGAKRLQEIIMQKPLTLKGNSGAIVSVAFTAGGRRLASVSAREAKVWDAVTGQEIKTLRQDKQMLPSGTFSPDGRRLASAGEGTLDNATMKWRSDVKIWDLETGKVVLTLQGHKGTVNGLAYSPDGTRLASAGQRSFDADNKAPKSEIKIWDARTGQEILTLKESADAVTNLTFSPDGTRLAMAMEGKVKVVDVATGQQLLAFDAHKETVTSLAFSPDGTRLASASEDWTVKLWDAATGKVLRTFQDHMQPVSSVTFSPDGKWLASGSLASMELWLKDKHPPGRGNDFEEPEPVPGKSGQVKIWDAATGQELLTLKGDAMGVSCLAFSPNSKRLACGGQDQTVKIWDLVIDSD